MTLFFKLVLFPVLVSAETEHSTDAGHHDAHGDVPKGPEVTSCGWHKTMYKSSKCCGQPKKKTGYELIPAPTTILNGKENPCAGTKPTGPDYDNTDCFKDGVVAVLEQAGTNVTKGYQGEMETSVVPIITSFFKAGLCPVNVHWHAGAEHYSDGEYDWYALEPNDPHEGESTEYSPHVRQGFRCHLYDHNIEMFTKPYNWQYCQNMKVGETYEVHWPHSAAGACGTPNQYQSPFYDGVFCLASGIIDGTNTQSTIGVQAQVFTVVNDETFYYPDLFRGMIVDGSYGMDVAKYTGATTGTSRNNAICSQYTPITWQVDRKCQLISASSFDKMCADMKAQRDDMSTDMTPHGARELVLDSLAANNQHRRVL